MCESKLKTFLIEHFELQEHHFENESPEEMAIRLVKEASSKKQFAIFAKSLGARKMRWYDKPFWRGFTLRRMS